MRLKDIDARLRPISKRVREVIAARERKAAAEAEVETAKRRAAKAAQRAEGQRIMQEQLTEALASEAVVGEVGEGGAFSIKRRKPNPPQDGIKLEEAP